MNPHKKHYNKILEMLKVEESRGLSEKEVRAARDYFGENKLDEKKKTPMIVKFLMQFNDFMIIILLAAAGVSFLTSYMQDEPDFIDPIIILMIVVLNAILGLVQESKAEKSMEALKKMSAPRAKVLREGEVLHIETKEIVTGDIIILETGDFVPADARLIESHNLKVEESSLTGESLSVEKDADIILSNDCPIGDRKNMVYSSSSITAGRGKAIVCYIGMDTEVGKIANMILADESPETPLQKRLEQMGKILGIGALMICGIVFAIGVARKIDAFEMFFTSVSLAVAAIPEGLPAIVTIMLAIGVQRMSKKNVIIRKLPAVETLGSATVICSDKTGTLTQNKMKVVEISNFNKKLSSADAQYKKILELGNLCNDTIVKNKNEVMGEPTEKAIIIAGLNININKNVLEEKYKRVSEIPFESSRKLMSTIHKKCESDNGYLVITKGAPDVLIEKCNYYEDETGKVVALTSEKRKALLNINFETAKKALRVLAVSYKEIKIKPSDAQSGKIENDLIFMGFIGMIDPPRKEVKEAVLMCKKAGIKPVMVTGDHVVTAIAIAQKIGIMSNEDKAMTGDEINNLSQEQLDRKIFEYSVFARLSPEHKVQIVKAYQNRGAVVAMTGDGVNDAPALKNADIGCAMGINGTEVAKSAADMVLSDDNFATIVDAVKEGRGIYANKKKRYTFYYQAISAKLFRFLCQFYWVINLRFCRFICFGSIL